MVRAPGLILGPFTGLLAWLEQVGLVPLVASFRPATWKLTRRAPPALTHLMRRGAEADRSVDLCLRQCCQMQGQPLFDFDWENPDENCVAPKHRQQEKQQNIFFQTVAINGCGGMLRLHEFNVAFCHFGGHVGQPHSQPPHPCSPKCLEQALFGVP